VQGRMEWLTYHGSMLTGERQKTGLFLLNQRPRTMRLWRPTLAKVGKVLGCVQACGRLATGRTDLRAQEHTFGDVGRVRDPPWRWRVRRPEQPREFWRRGSSTARGDCFDVWPHWPKEGARSILVVCIPCPPFGPVPKQSLEAGVCAHRSGNFRDEWVPIAGSPERGF